MTPFAEERRLMYVAMTRTRNRLYITAPTDFPSRFLIELIDRYGIRKPQGMSMKICDTVRDRCPVCGYPLRRQFNKTHGLDLFICTNDPDVCDFMTNDIKNPYDIEICDWCAAAGREGYLIVKNGKEGVMYGCTNYSTYGKKLCKRVKRIP